MKEAEDKAAAEAARAAAKEEARKAAAARAVVEKQAKLDRIMLEDSLRAKPASSSAAQCALE